MNYYIPSTTEKFNIMVDNVNMIQNIINSNIKTIQSYSTIHNCCQLLTAYLHDAVIIDDGRDLTPFTNIIQAGLDFTGLEI
jgi:hypothetical protein